MCFKRKCVFSSTKGSNSLCLPDTLQLLKLTQSFLLAPPSDTSVWMHSQNCSSTCLAVLRRYDLMTLKLTQPDFVKIWINRDLKNLPDLYDERLKACSKLESAELALIKMAAKLRKKQLKKEGKTEKDAGQLEANDIAAAADELGGGKRHKSVRHSEGEGVRASHTMLRPWLWTELLTAVVGSNTAQETAQIGKIILSIIRKYRRKT